MPEKVNSKMENVSIFFMAVLGSLLQYISN